MREREGGRRERERKRGGERERESERVSGKDRERGGGGGGGDKHGDQRDCSRRKSRMEKGGGEGAKMKEKGPCMGEP